MDKCAVEDCNNECIYGVNAVLLNPFAWNDKRMICDECNGIARDEQGRIIYQRIDVKQEVMA